MAVAPTLYSLNRLNVPLALSPAGPLANVTTLTRAAPPIAATATVIARRWGVVECEPCAATAVRVCGDTAVDRAASALTARSECTAAVLAQQKLLAPKKAQSVSHRGPGHMGVARQAIADGQPGRPPSASLRRWMGLVQLGGNSACGLRFAQPSPRPASAAAAISRAQPWPPCPRSWTRALAPRRPGPS